jgi:hypothetical protein
LAALTRAINRLVGAVFCATLLLGGALLYLNGETLVGGVGLGLAVLAFLWVLRG